MKFLRSFSIVALIVGIVSALTLFGQDSTPVRSGSKVTLIATADGNPEPTFEWFLNGVKIADGPQLVIDSVSVAHAGSYTAKASNRAGSAISAPSILVVDDSSGPVIAQQPADGQPLEGSKFVLAVVATGSPAPTYQWRKNGADIPGATSSTITFNSISRTDSGLYDVRISNTAGTVVSFLAAVDVLYPPSVPIIKKELGTVTVNRKDTATFVVEATGVNLKYQWRDNKGRLLKESGPTLTLPFVNPSFAGPYSVTITSGAFSVTSRGALVVL